MNSRSLMVSTLSTHNFGIYSCLLLAPNLYTHHFDVLFSCKRYPQELHGRMQKYQKSRTNSYGRMIGTMMTLPMILRNNYDNK